MIRLLADAVFDAELAFAAVLAVVGVAGLLLAGGARIRRGAAAVFALVWLGSVLSMTLRPGSELGVRLNLVPLAFDGTGSTVDAVLNVFVFLPFGLLLAAAGVRFAPAFASGLALSLFIEVTQYVTDLGRTADVNDVITNSAGAALGWGLGFLVVRTAGWASPRIRSARMLRATP